MKYLPAMSLWLGNKIDESLDQYLQTLHLISKDCRIKPVAAEINCDEYIQDTFINKLLSTHMDKTPQE